MRGAATKRIARRQHDHDSPRRGHSRSERNDIRKGAIWAEPDVNSCQTIAIMRQCDLSECCGACSWSVVWDRCAPRHRIGRQNHQSNDQPAPARQQRRPARGQPPKASQTAARHGGWTKQQPQGCAMQRLVGHQSKPVGSVEVCRSCTLNLSLAALSSGHDRAASLRLHRTVPAVEGGSAAVRPALGSRNQARRLSADGAPGRLAGPLLHTGGYDWADRFPPIVDAALRLKARRS